MSRLPSSDMQSPYDIFASDLDSPSEPQCDVYALWHVCRHVERNATAEDLGINSGIRTVEFHSIKSNTLPTFAVKNPPVETPAEAVCFFATPPVTSKTNVLEDMFRFLRPRLEQLVVTPAAVGEFSGNEVLACESLGHKARINACIEDNKPMRRSNLLRRAIFMYEAALRMTSHPTVIKLLDRVARHTDEVYVIRLNDSVSGISLYLKRFISSAFAGLAMCSMYQGNFARFGSYASLTVGWDDVGGIFALNAIRTIALLDSKFEMYLFITRSVLLPYLVRTGRRSVLTDELRLCTPACQREQTLALVLALADNFNGPTPPRHFRTRIVNGKVVDRVCAVCGKIGGKLHHCSKCKAVYYCGKDCQKMDWDQHRAMCGSEVADLVWKRVV